jgi:hypothetical protein
VVFGTSFALLVMLQPSSSAQSPKEPVANFRNWTADLADDQRFRRDVGLPSSTSAIKEIYERDLIDRKASQRWGAPVTRDEALRLNEWAELSNYVYLVKQYAAERAPNSFGGVYIDEQASGGMMNVSFTSEAAAHLQRLKNRFPYPDKLRLFSVSYPEAEMRQLQDDVSAAKPDLESRGIVVLELVSETDDNLLAIGVENADSETVDYLNGRFGADRILVYETEAAQSTSRINSSAPLKAGVEVRNTPYPESYSSCTAGFGANRVEAAEGGLTYTNFYQLTAGHCTKAFQYWHHYTRYIGSRHNAGSYYHGTKFDGGLIDIPAGENSARIYATYNSTHGVNSVESNTNDSQGQAICLSAVVANNECGTVQSTRAEATVTENGTSLTLINQRVASFSAAPGDSGGPIWRDGASDNKAVGVASGRFTGGTYLGQAYYSHIGFLRDYFSNFYVNKV